MVIQSFVPPGDVCNETELFFRNETEAVISDSKDHAGLILDEGAILSSDTYMNFLDKTAWRCYTSLLQVSLTMYLEGKGVVELYENDVLVQTISFQFAQPDEISFDLDMQSDGICFFKIRAEEKTVLYQASYLAGEQDQPSAEVRLAILICTYKREQILTDNLRCLGRSLFFEEGSDYFGKMFLYVTDNASTLRKEDIIEEDPAIQNMADYLCLKQSENLGGSGGFTKCILEARQNHEQFPATHVVFMDDDVLFIPETFYRLYTLLSYIRPEYESEVIAGRMFRMDQRNIQYTASEVWNKGELIHMGFQEDMCNREYIFSCNEERDEYTGWWFAAYPYSFVAANLPLPFFLHCDDVEYGLRHKGSPVVLNGIQVWHETYEYRASSEIAYYDLKNSMIVNAIYGLLPDQEEFSASWNERLTKQQEKEDPLAEHMLLLAMRDFLKGKRYFLHRDIAEEHKKVSEVEKSAQIQQENDQLSRWIDKRIQSHYKRIIRDYQS